MSVNQEPVRSAADERHDRYRAVFASTNGQWVLDDLAGICFRDSTTLVYSEVDGKVDPLYTIYHEGMRTVFLTIQRALEPPRDLPDAVNAGPEPIEQQEV